jgi:hypothetical protein
MVGLCSASILLLTTIIGPWASADTLLVNGQYQDSQSYFDPPFDPYPPYNQGTAVTIHNFAITPFTAQLQAHTGVSLTISAPAGQEFVFRAPAGITPVRFIPNFFFAADGSRRDIYEGVTSLSFQGLGGVAPTLGAFQSNVSRVADSGSFFALDSEYEYSSEFSFRSMTISAVFPAGGWETKTYSPWDARIIAYATSDSDVGALSELRQVAPVPEIDPAGLGSVLALIGGGLGLLERRRRRA